jgi:hypothetical protein
MIAAGQIDAARGDIAVFADIIGQPLKSWQSDALQLNKRVTVVVAPRQTGKSRSLSVLALHRAYRRAGTHVLILSAGDEAAKRLLAEVRRIAAGSPLLAGSVVEERTSLLRLTNGSTVRSVPASEQQVRGWSIDLLLVDEAAMIDDALLLQGAFPTTMARPDARIVLASSPFGTSGAFYSYAMRGQNGSESTSTFRWRLADAVWVSTDTIASLREGLSELGAAAELDGEFVDIDGGHRLVQDAWTRAAQGRVLRVTEWGTAGLDVARFGGDSTSLYANRGGVVRRVFVARKLDTTEVTERLVGEMREQLNSPPMRVVVIVDDAGVGGGVTDQASRRALTVVPFLGAERAHDPRRFANRRAETFWLLREALRDGLVDLDPADRDLAAQLGELRYEFDERGRLLIESKSKMARRGVSSPDAADAVAMTFATEAWRPPVEWSMSAQEIEDAELHRALASIDAAWARRRFWDEHGGVPESLPFGADSLTGDLLVGDM